MEKDTSICQGCGEQRYKCWCDEICKFCGKNAIACMQESESGWCPLDPNLEKYLEFQKSINKQS